MSLRHCLIPMATWLMAYGALADTSRKISWGGFIEGQYAYDFNTPTNGDRAYTTQPARSNEFNINLAFLEAKLESSKVRSRLALQVGTSVQSNYSSEPRRGSVSGGDLSRHIQEARVGYKLSEKTWVDGGVFFAHVGSESFISRDNLVLTRSLVADYSPYYLSGFKLTHTPTDRVTLQVLVTNGWQNVSENNSDKNIGTGIEYATPDWSLGYNTMIGREQSADIGGSSRVSEFRQFHDLILRSRGTGDWEWIAQLDVGLQKKPDSSSYSDWMGTSLMTRYSINPDQKIALRAETYRDADQIIIVTSRPEAINVVGGSIGFDQSLEDGVCFRSEARYLKADRDVFPKGGSSWSSENFTLTTSLAVTF